MLPSKYSKSDSSVNKKGSAVAVTPTNDGGKVYNDNSWHQIIATRIQALGNITMDGQYTGNQFIEITLLLLRVLFTCFFTTCVHSYRKKFTHFSDCFLTV